MAIRAVNGGLERLSTLLLFFGLALLVLGAGVQISRSVRVRDMETRRAAPAFHTSLRHVAAAIPAGAVDRTAGAPPARIVIPSIELDSQVVPVGWEARIVNGEFQGNIWQTADFAAGYHESSALPSTIGNTVISGHNNELGAVFKDIHNVDLGDEILLYDVDGRRYAYEVVESFILREEGAPPAERMDNTQWIRPSPDERLTLVSCFPPWSNTHRIIVLAFPAPEPPPPSSDLGWPHRGPAVVTPIGR